MLAQSKLYLQKSATFVNNAREVGVKGTLWSSPFVAWDIANAPKGYRVSDGLSSGISQLVITPALTTLTYIGLACLFPEIGVGWVATLAASAIATPAAQFVETRLNRGFRLFKDLDKQQRTLQLGFKDTENSQAYRQHALQEMSGASSSSRRYLGNEAYHLHR